MITGSLTVAQRFFDPSGHGPGDLHHRREVLRVLPVRAEADAGQVAAIHHRTARRLEPFDQPGPA
jgi:hypothetical protein